MNIPVTEELKNICKAIVETNWTESRWAEHESDDWFQSESFEGGFDADENAFCFSYYDADKNEFWLQFTLADVRKILDGKITSVEGRKPE